MYNHKLHHQVNSLIQHSKLDVGKADMEFYSRFIANATAIKHLYDEIYAGHKDADNCFNQLLQIVLNTYQERHIALKKRDEKKQESGQWFLSNKLAGMSLYVDRFCDNLPGLQEKLFYFKNLGVNLLHLMPIFESPASESDGGYAVSNYRKVDARFGTLKDLQSLQQKLMEEGFYLMIDIVLNHTSQQHEWAMKAKAGDPYYQDFFYMYDDHTTPAIFEGTLPEIFPESAPGNFTFIPECNKWVMTVFHQYQWDLNYTNPHVFLAMLDTVFFYANLGIDVLRIDAPAFIWKKAGTTSQNLPEAHTILRLIKQCVNTAAPGMALLGEAIVAPRYIMEYFGTGLYTGKECDFAYNATHMAVQWDALATSDTRVMLAAQKAISHKPKGTSWINYTRCHDDIGLGYDDHMISTAGFAPYAHRSFIKDYFSGNFPGSPAMGALFSFNPKTNDARISGTLASLCGLEKSLINNDKSQVNLSIQKIIMMQAHSFFLGGLPMIFYGDEAAYTNDYSYKNDPAKSYDNRWMHRPIINWTKNKKVHEPGTVEEAVFSKTKKLLATRSRLDVVADYSNISWLATHNRHTACYTRTADDKKLYCIFNFSSDAHSLNLGLLQLPAQIKILFDHWTEKEIIADPANFLQLQPYGFALLEIK